MSHISEADVRRSDPDRSLVSIAASDGPLQYSDRSIGLLTSFEWDGNDNGQEMSGFDDPAAATATDTQWCLDTLLPAAQQEVAARRSPAIGRPAGYSRAWTSCGRNPQVACLSLRTPGMRTRRIHGAARSTWISLWSKMKRSAMRGEECGITPCSGQCNFPAIQDKSPESIQGTRNSCSLQPLQEIRQGDRLPHSVIQPLMIRNPDLVLGLFSGLALLATPIPVYFVQRLLHNDTTKEISLDNGRDDRRIFLAGPVLLVVLQQGAVVQRLDLGGAHAGSEPGLAGGGLAHGDGLLQFLVEDLADGVADGYLSRQDMSPCCLER